MARPLRVEFEGAVYHLMSRGDRREAIFRDDTDRNGFVELLAEACLKTGWQVHAYCLMGNHFHMVVETPQPNLVAGMKWLLGTSPGGLTGVTGSRGIYLGADIRPWSSIPQRRATC